MKTMDEMRRGLGQLNLDNQAASADNEQETVSPDLYPNNVDTLQNSINKSNCFSFEKLPKNNHFLYNLYWNPERKVEVKNTQEILPPLLRPHNADALIDIINELDPFSFVKLSQTCHYLSDFCWNATGINVPLNCSIEVDSDGAINIWNGDKKFIYNYYNNCKNVAAAPFWEKTHPKTKQFRIHVELVRMHHQRLDGITWPFAATRRLLGYIGCRIAERLWLCDDNFFRISLVSTDLIQFVEEFGVKEFSTCTVLEDHTIQYLLRNMTCLRLPFEDASRFDLFPMVPSHLQMGECVSFDGFAHVLRAWARYEFEIDEWVLGSDFSLSDVVDDFVNIFPSYSILGLFFNFPLPSTRPLFLINVGDKFSYYLMRSDGRILGMGHPHFAEYGINDDVMILRQLNPVELHKELPMLCPTIGNEEDVVD